MVATQVEPNGWPFGLEKMNIWLRVNDAPHSQVDTLSLDPSPLCVVHSPSLSSFSSSNLDTECISRTTNWDETRRQEEVVFSESNAE
ncbi:PREDICTED: uncharacterized protein LOC109167273 isoform X2 [Ipomoea nil]|uniref:uncharacterized protein LOC109167273 isoform X2 n=1 Tax=Ipomoea nil TaxID=35883 RepID=UPI000901DD9C|nr:PREDICTED: uncharacterized protein LOC109167273 isoform X2 [Ipomoea nil]